MKNEQAKEAKIRISRRALRQIGDDSIYLFNRKLELKEVIRMREIIAKAMLRDRFLNPLEKLMNKEEYESIPDDQKMRYILEFCSIFVRLKNTMKL